MVSIVMFISLILLDLSKALDQVLAFDTVVPGKLYRPAHKLYSVETIMPCFCLYTSLRVNKDVLGAN